MNKKASPPRQGASLLHNELASQEKRQQTSKASRVHQEDPDRLADAPAHLRFVNPFRKDDEFDVGHRVDIKLQFEVCRGRGEVFLSLCRRVYLSRLTG